MSALVRHCRCSAHLRNSASRGRGQATTSRADLEEKIVPQVLHAPKTGGDPESREGRLAVHERVVMYLYYHVSGKPWMNHLALVAAVLTARQRDVNTVRCVLTILHVRFTELF